MRQIMHDMTLQPCKTASAQNGQFWRICMHACCLDTSKHSASCGHAFLGFQSANHHECSQLLPAQQQQQQLSFCPCLVVILNSLLASADQQEWRLHAFLLAVTGVPSNVCLP